METSVRALDGREEEEEEGVGLLVLAGCGCVLFGACAWVWMVLSSAKWLVERKR